MKPLTICRRGEALLNQEGLTVESLPGEFQKAFPDLSPKYIDHLSLMAGIASQRALSGLMASLSLEEKKDFSIIVGNAFGAIESTVVFDAQALEKGPNAVNPMDFPNTVANAAGSRIGIWLQMKGPNITLTNGYTSLIDAIGFAWEGFNSGLYRNCLVGAVEKVPDFLKPFILTSHAAGQLKEGASFFVALEDPNQESLFQVTDYFSLQLKPDFSFPSGFLDHFKQFWDGVEWLGCPGEAHLDERFQKNVFRYSTGSAPLEIGLGGLDYLNGFLSAPQTCGIIGAFSKPERKFSLIKVKKNKRSS